MWRYALSAGVIVVAALSLAWGGPSAGNAVEVQVLADFESPGDIYQWEKLRFPVQDTPQVFDIALSRERASRGASALKVVQPLEQAQRVAWGTVAVPADWSAWETLKWDVYWDAPAETPGRLTVSVDIADRDSTALWTDHFHRGFHIRPGWNTLSVTVAELQTRIDARRIEQLAFGLNCSTPTTIYLDNVRLEGKRTQPLPRPTLMLRRHLTDRTFVWMVGDDFRRWQVIADGYYEPKGWEPSDDLIAEMEGLRFVEESRLAAGHEDCKVWVTLAKDALGHSPSPPPKPGAGGQSVPPEVGRIVEGRVGDEPHLEGGGNLPVEGGGSLPVEAGTIDFWVTVAKDTADLVGDFPLVSARKDEANLLQVAFHNDDLFFEIRRAGERHIARRWWMAIWGDIRKRPVHWRAGSLHHIRITWGPEGMFLYLDDREVPYWPPSLSRKKDLKLPASPYAGPLPEGLGPLRADYDKAPDYPFKVPALRIRNRQVRGPEWEDLPFVRAGTLVSAPLDRGRRYREPAFALRRFGYEAEVPPGTALSFSFRGSNEPASGRWSPWTRPITGTADSKASLPEEVLAELSRYRYLQVKVLFRTDDPRLTPRLRRYYFLQYQGRNPCLFLTEERLKVLRERCQGPNRALFDRLKQAAEEGQASALANAFLYQITNDRKYAQQAKAALDQILTKRNFAEPSEAVAIDWILPVCTPEERLRYIKMLTAGLWDYGMLPQNVWWNQMYNNWRHSYTHTFLKNLTLVQVVGQVPAGKPLTEETLGFDLFRLKHSFDSTVEFFKLFVIPAVNRTGGVWPEGFGYHAFTGPGPALSVAAWASATGEDLWEEAWAFRNVPAWYFYSRRPHLGRTVAVNDDRGGQRALMSAWLPMLAAVYRDPIAQRDARAIAEWMAANARGERPNVPGFGYYSLVDFLLWYDPEVPAADLKALPLDRYFPEAGWVLMRSGWQPDATFALLMAGDWFGGHKQADTGSFLICKRGDLALDPPDSRRDAYRQHFAYRVKSIAHNVVAVDDPTEPAGDGGQHRPGMPQLGDVRPGTVFDTADILAYQSTPAFNYTAADLTGAYGKWRFGYPRIVRRYYRQFLYLRPDTFVVFDRVTLTDPRYQCRWLLHALNRPAVDGKGEEVTPLRTRYPATARALIEEGEGALRVVPVVPQEGALFLREVQGTHKDEKIVPQATVWQLELEQAEKAAERRFLVVMVAGSKEAPPEPAVEPLREGSRVGVAVTVGEQKFRVLFDQTGEPGGSVTVIGPDGAERTTELPRKVVK